MKKPFLLVLLIVLFSGNLIASKSIVVTQKTIKIESQKEDVFYFGFAAGDQLTLNFETMDGKELTELEIMELNGAVLFKDYKSKKIKNSAFKILKTGILKFRLLNSASGGRVCKIKIQRAPASKATQQFNTTVYWKQVFDTSYTMREEKYLIKKDTGIINITEQLAKVHSKGNPNGSRTSLNFALPDYTVAWSYYIGVEQEGQVAFKKAMTELTLKAAPILLKFPEYGPLAALALGGISYLSYLKSGEEIDYYIVTPENEKLFSESKPFKNIKVGKVINDFSRMITPLSGMHYVCLYNDNMVKSLSVYVRITAIVVYDQWGKMPMRSMNVTSRQEAYLKN